MGTYVPPLPLQVFKVKQPPVVGSAWLNQIDLILQGNVPADGVYNSTFLSGQVQVTGPTGLLTSYGDLTFGLNIPNPSGAPGVALLLGGAGKSRACLLTDAQIPSIDGIELLIASGSAAISTNKNGGALRLLGGAADGGVGGPAILQAGTAINGPGGDVAIQGGNSSNGPAGNVYIIAGTTGSVGGGVKIYATNLNNVAGDISFWLGQPDIPHSIPLWTMSHTGALFPGNQGAGNPGDVLVSAGNLQSPSWAPPGLEQQILLTLSGATQATPTSSFTATSNLRQASITTNGPVTAITTGPNDIILSTLPAIYRPNMLTTCLCAGLVNGSNSGYIGVATIDSLGGITISLFTGGLANPNNWSVAPGTQKGLTNGFSITYPL